MDQNNPTGTPVTPVDPNAQPAVPGAVDPTGQPGGAPVVTPEPTGTGTPGAQDPNAPVAPQA